MVYTKTIKPNNNKKDSVSPRKLKGYSSDYIEKASGNDHKLAMKITLNQPCVTRLLSLAEGTWIVRVSSKHQFLKKDNYDLTMDGFNNNDVMAILSLSVHQKLKIEHYRFIVMINKQTKAISYAMPSFNYSSKGNKIIYIKFKVNQNKNQNIQHYNFDNFISSLSLDPNMEYDESSSYIISDLYNTYVYN